MIEKSITEDGLLYHLECPLHSNGLVSLQEGPPVLKCSQETLRWLISEIGCGPLPSSRETRVYFENQWQQTNYYRSCGGISPKKYNRLLMEGPRACRRLGEILFRCEILQPVTPYELVIDGISITGEYAVLRSSRRKRQAFVLYLRYGGVKVRPVVPDIISFARWADVSKRRETQNWNVDRICVMHYWVNLEMAAEHLPEPEFAADVLKGVASLLSRPPFPVVGEHCLSCPTRGCNPKPKQQEPSGDDPAESKPRRSTKRGRPKPKLTLKISDKERVEILRRMHVRPGPNSPFLS